MPTARTDAIVLSVAVSISSSRVPTLIEAIIAVVAYTVWLCRCIVCCFVGSGGSGARHKELVFVLQPTQCGQLFFAALRISGLGSSLVLDATAKVVKSLFVHLDGSVRGSGLSLVKPTLCTVSLLASLALFREIVRMS